MKNNLIKFLLVVMISSALLISIISCSSSPRPTIKTIKTIDIDGKVTHLPILVDLSISETKVSGTAQREYKKREPNEYDIEFVKQMALTEDVNKSNADAIIEPRYVITVKNKTDENYGVIFEHRITVIVEVTGYPATYSNFRQITDQDIKFFQDPILTP